MPLLPLLPLSHLSHLSLLLLVSLLPLALAYNNGYAARPPLGVSTWSTDDFAGLRDWCSDREMVLVGEAMVHSGLAAAGYTWVLLDDCWASGERSADGAIVADAQRFPRGIAPLAADLHALGLRLGVYTSIGETSCRGGRAGSGGHYAQDAATFASWGVDAVKCDNCGGGRPANSTDEGLYREFSAALNATGHPMMFMLCNWGKDNVSQWGAGVGQTFRIQMDHLPFYELPTHAAGVGYGQGVADVIRFVATLKPSEFVKQYGWMDADFLETLAELPGLETMTFEDSRTEMTFWSAWSSPLMVATDVRNMTAQKRELLLNPEVLAVNQDESFTAADKIHESPEFGQVWARPLADGGIAVILYNANLFRVHINVTVEWSMLGLSGSFLVRDLWARKDLGSHADRFTASDLAPHAVRFIKVTRASGIPQK